MVLSSITSSVTSSAIATVGSRDAVINTQINNANTRLPFLSSLCALLSGVVILCLYFPSLK